MVLPIPAVSITPVPTDFALKNRNWFWVLAWCLILSAMAQMYVFLNIVGGFLMIVIATIGFYTIREHSVDMNCLMTWGMICLVNGVFDTVFLIDRVVKMPNPPLAFSLPCSHNFKWLMIIGGPVSEVVVAVLVYKVYKDATDMESTFQIETAATRQPRFGPPGGVGGGGGGGLPNYGSGPVGSSPSPSPPTAAPTFTPFAGRGNTLGTE